MQIISSVEVALINNMITYPSAYLETINKCKNPLVGRSALEMLH
jgi:hypothetical protein